MKLYTCEGSRGFRVSWAAEELGIDLETELLPFPPRAHAKSYFAINPLGTVPALVDGQMVLTESCAILQYLATKYGEAGLAVPPHEPDFGAWLDFLHHADATLTFPQTLVLRFVHFEPERGLQEVGELYADWFAKRLVKVDQRLQGRQYLCADRFTVADIAIGYALHLTSFSRLEDRLTPRLTEWLAMLRERPAFRRAVAREAAAAAAAAAGI